MNADTFISTLRGCFPELTAVQEERFRALEALYGEWNSRINVISRKDMDGLYDHHVLHSVAIAKYMQDRMPELLGAMRGSSVLDIGTGGGFPGIPLAILFPETKFTLCDSVGKKIKVASGIAGSLGLGNVETVNARAESLGRGFGFIVSRAVAPLPVLYSWAKGRYSHAVLCLKGGDVSEEIAETMSRHGLPKGSVHTWPVDSWLHDPYFGGKLVIHIGA